MLKRIYDKTRYYSSQKVNVIAQVSIRWQILRQQKADGRPLYKITDLIFLSEAQEQMKWGVIRPSRLRDPSNL